VAARAKQQTPRTPDGHPDLQGIYNVETITPVERPAGVRSLVLTDQEAAALEAYEQQRNAKSLEPSRPDRGAPPVGGETSTPKSYLEFLERAGGGAVGGYNNLKQIVQTRDTIMILNEMVHDVRFIRMNATHLPQNVRNWLGDSVGRWEGDTLVVETTNFTDKTQFNGSGKDLEVTERFTRVDDKTLLYRFTVDDPSTWEKPWTGEYPWVASDEPLYEYACHEGNYSLESILKGARLDEADAAKKGAER
jgi:hypothetical protein